MTPPQQAVSAMRCLVNRTLCAGFVWAIVIAQASVAPGQDSAPASSNAAKLPAGGRRLSEAAGADAVEGETAATEAAAPEAAESKPDVSEEAAKADAAEDEAAKADAAAKTAAADAAASAAADAAASAAAGAGEIEKLKADVARLQTEAADKAALEQTSAAALHSLQEKSAAQESQLQLFKSQIETMTQEKTTAESALDAALDAKAKLADEVTSKGASINELTSNLNSKSDEYSKAQNEISSTQATLTETQRDLENANEELKKIPILQKQLDDLNKEHTDTKEQLVASQADTDQLTKEKEKLNEDRWSQFEEMKKIKKEHADLHEKYADPSVQHFLMAKAVKVYRDPGISGAGNKTFVYILPTLQTRYDKGKQFVQASESAVYKKLNAYLGHEKVEPWLPAVSGILVYGSIILPFMCTVCCLTRIVCKLRPLLLFCHLDFLLTSLCAGGFALYTGKEPLAVFAHHDASVYLFTQAIFAIVYCLYFILLVLAYCKSKRDTWEGTYRCMQLVGVLPLFIIYYKHVWTPAMSDEMPKMDELVEWLVGDGAAVSKYAWLPYLPVSLLFLLALRLERLSWQAACADSPAAKKDTQMSVVMKSDIELATVVGDSLDGDWGSWGDVDLGIPEDKKE